MVDSWKRIHIKKMCHLWITHFLLTTIMSVGLKNRI